MLKETEDAIVFFVKFLSLLAFQWEGGFPAPSPAGYAYVLFLSDSDCDDRWQKVLGIQFIIVSFIFVHKIIAHLVCSYKIMPIRKGDICTALFLNVKIGRRSLTEGVAKTLMEIAK